MDDQQLLVSIGHKIKMIRTSQHVSQQDLAAKCNFEKTNMSRLEHGRTNPSIKVLYKISTALGVKLRDLLDVEE